MDIFCEQIVKKKKTPFEKLTVALIWIGGWVLCMAVAFLGLSSRYLPIFLLAAGFVVYFTLKIAAKLNLEYEYCVTNDLLDIDKIINRSDRKRMISVEISNFDRFEEFDPQKPENDVKRYDMVVSAVADPQSEDAVYCAVVRHPAKGKILIVFQPNQKVLDTITRALPRNLRYHR